MSGLPPPGRRCPGIPFQLGILSVFLLSSRDKQLSRLVPGGEDSAVLPALPSRKGPNSQDFITALLGGRGCKVRTVGIPVGTGPALPATGRPRGGAACPSLTYAVPSAAVCDRCSGSPRQMVTQMGLLAGCATRCPPITHTLMCLRMHIGTLGFVVKVPAWGFR